jgi:hypothetical protein
LAVGKLAGKWLFCPLLSHFADAYTRIKPGIKFDNNHAETFFREREKETAMHIHLQSSHLVAMIAIALSSALLLAVKFRPATWRGVLCEAVIANIGAILAIVAFEVLIA